MLRWLTDQGWVSWSYLTLNTRKTLYRMRGARGRTPCQSASDSGKANETRCEACFVVKDPQRFRAVCPALKVEKGQAPLCTVDASDVRPFWGRALAFYGKVLLGLYLVAVCSGFIALRSLGYRVSPVDVGWPRRWGQITLARADYFYEQGIAAYRDHDIKLSLLALTEAYQLAPDRNEDGTLILAQLTQITWPTLSNEIYARIVADRGPRAAAALEAWARALLARGDLPGLARLASDRLAAGDPLSSVWTHALVFSCQATGDWSPVAKALTSASLPRDCREVLSVTAAGVGKSVPDKAARLEAALGTISTSFARFELAERLIDLGRPNTAISWVQEHLDLIAPRERACLILDASAAGGWDELRRRQFANLLAEPKSPMLINLLVGHLIRYPDTTMTEELFERLNTDPLPAKADTYGAYNALLCLAGSERSETRIDAQIQTLRAISGTRSFSLDVVKEFFLNRADLVPISQYLPAVQPLSLEVSYALLRRFPGHPAAQGRGQGQGRSH